jgi:GNAT superfamily N-acetyltransferase
MALTRNSLSKRSKTRVSYKLYQKMGKSFFSMPDLCANIPKKSCCILTRESATNIRLRQMAVRPNQQGKGIGQQIMRFAEMMARDKGYKVLSMHARDTAIGFYEKQGYKVVGKPFLEVTIPHHKMEKSLLHL